MPNDQNTKAEIDGYMKSTMKHVHQFGITPILMLGWCEDKQQVSVITCCPIDEASLKEITELFARQMAAGNFTIQTDRKHTNG